MGRRDWYGTGLVAVLIALVIILSKTWAAPVLGVIAFILVVLIVVDAQKRTPEKSEAKERVTVAKRKKKGGRVTEPKERPKPHQVPKANPDITFHNNRIIGPKGHGISVPEGTSLSAEGNTFEEVGGDAMHVREAGKTEKTEPEEDSGGE